MRFSRMPGESILVAGRGAVFTVAKRPALLLQSGRVAALDLLASCLGRWYLIIIVPCRAVLEWSATCSISAAVTMMPVAVLRFVADVRGRVLGV